MCRSTIQLWCMAIRSSYGRGSIHGGLFPARTSISGLDLESGHSSGLGGAGRCGALIGSTDASSIMGRPTCSAATRFTTGTLTSAEITGAMHRPMSEVTEPCAATPLRQAGPAFQWVRPEPAFRLLSPGPKLHRAGPKSALLAGLLPALAPAPLTALLEAETREGTLHAGNPALGYLAAEERHA